jgi:glycogen synthase
MVAGMSRDFSWDRSGEKYMEVYQRVLKDPPFQAL